MLRKKLFRDIKQNSSQFITIFLMVFLGVFVFSGIHSYMDGMKKSGDDYYKKNNLEDLWLSGENFTANDLSNAKKINNVVNAERILQITTTLDNYNDVTLQANFIESNEISKMNIVEGTKFDKDKKGVWLDSYLAKNLGLKVGDTITFTYQKYKVTEEIVGLINTHDHVYTIKDETTIFSDHKDFGYIYLSINEFPIEYIYDELIENTGIKDIDLIKTSIKNFDISDYYVFSQIIVDVNDVTKIDDTKTLIENNITSAIAVTDRESSASYESYNSEIEEGNTYSGVFTLLFLFIALLSVITTMNRFVKKQRTQIGTLKALGFKDRKITFHYISYGFYISMVASFLGIVLGAFTLGNFFLSMQKTFFEVPHLTIVILPVVYILSIAVIILVTLITYLSCKKILKEPASESLRLQIPKVKKTKFKITTKGIFKNSSMSTKWNLRDIMRNKSRSIMAIVGIMGSCMLLVCAFGMLNTMNSYLDWQYDKLSNFEYKLTLETDYNKNDFENLINIYGNKTSETLGVEIKIGDTKETNSLTISDASGFLRYTDHNKKFINLKNNGIYITEKLADKLDLEIGDKISFHIFGDSKYYDVKIIGLNRDPQNQQLTMTRDFYESLGLTYKSDTIYTNNDLSSTKELNGVSTIQSIDSLKGGMENMLDTMKMMIVLLVIVSATLGRVIIYNLGIMSFSEKQYQFATLKVLGFKDKQIKNIFVKQNTWLTIIAIIIGLPLGYQMTNFIFISALGDSYDFSAHVNISSYIIACFGTLLVSFIVNKFLAKKVNSIDMVSSLKGNE